MRFVYAWAVYSGAIVKSRFPYLAKEYADVIVLTMALTVVLLPLARKTDLLDGIVVLYSIPIAFGGVCLVRESIEFAKWIYERVSVS